jgi:hypothetical protein
MANVRAERHSVGFQKIPEGFLEAGWMCDSGRLLVVAQRRPAIDPVARSVLGADVACFRYAETSNYLFIPTMCHLTGFAIDIRTSKMSGY